MRKVILIGGAPLVGKSTVARELGARLHYGCLGTDDLGQAIRAVTTAQTHPAFHYMDGVDYREYYITRSLQQLVIDAEQYQQALWPALVPVITAHATWGDPAVIEGWALTPDYVAQLDVQDSAVVWLVAAEGLLETRMRQDAPFYRGAPDPEKLIRRFVARSLWLNLQIREAAERLGQPVIEVGEEDTPSALCERVMDVLKSIE